MPSSDSDQRDADEESAPRWVLVRDTPAIPDLGLDSRVEVVRDVDHEEWERLRGAEAAFDRFGDAWAHTQMIRHAQVFAASTAELWTSRARASGMVNPADVERVRWAFLEFAKLVVSWARESNDHADADVAGVAREVLDSAPLMTCALMVEDPPKVVLFVATKPTGEPVLAVARSDELGNVTGDTYDATMLVDSAVRSAQRLADIELVSAETTLLAAGSTLMSLLSDIVYGAPALSSAPFDPIGTRQLQLAHVGVAKVAPVMYAVDVARRRRGAAQASPPRKGGEGPDLVTGESVTEPPPSGADGVTGEGDQAAGGGSESPSSADPRTISEAESVDPSTMSEAARSPIDLGGLLREVVTIPREMEKRWFSALAAGMTEDANDLRARIQSLVTALAARAAVESAIEEARGESTALPGVPLSYEDANLLEGDPDAERERMQHGLALVRVVVNLVDALNELNQPSAVAFDRTARSATAWWSLDVFTRVADSAALAVRVADGDPDDDETYRGRMLDNALRAWASSLPEAAAVYTVQALDAERERAGPLCRAYETLVEIATRLAEGRRVKMSATLPVTDFWLQEIFRRRRAARHGHPSP